MLPHRPPQSRYRETPYGRDLMDGKVIYDNRIEDHHRNERRMAPSDMYGISRCQRKWWWRALCFCVEVTIPADITFRPFRHRPVAADFKLTKLIYGGPSKRTDRQQRSRQKCSLRSRRLRWTKSNIYNLINPYRVWHHRCRRWPPIMGGAVCGLLPRGVGGEICCWAAPHGWSNN